MFNQFPNQFKVHIYIRHGLEGDCPQSLLNPHKAVNVVCVGDNLAIVLLLHEHVDHFVLLCKVAAPTPPLVVEELVEGDKVSSIQGGELGSILGDQLGASLLLVSYARPL